MEKKRVAVIGAGVSGLITCKQLLDQGFNPVVFESDSDIGGVWGHTLGSTRLQSLTIVYQFSDFPWPDSITDTRPHNSQVMEYIRSYASHFGLFRCIKFKHRVVSIEYIGTDEEKMVAWESWAGNGEAFGGGQGVWLITVEHEGSIETYQMDFVILCIGQHSGLPNIPKFQEGKGPEVFQGQVLHSMDYSNMGPKKAAELVKNKLVSVVGFHKSATDIAAECANVNGSKLPCTMIIRSKAWNIPNHTVWFGIPIALFYLNRFAELLIHKPGEGVLLWLLATVLTPLGWLFSKFCESYFKFCTPMKKYGMVPDHSFFRATLSYAFTLLPEKFYDKVEEGSIILKKAKTFSFCKDGVIPQGEDLPIKSDLVIFATGFKAEQKLKDIFKSSFFQSFVDGSRDSPIPLYRECIHPRIPQLAIIGYCESAAGLFTTELRSKWVIHFMKGGFKLPSIASMENHMREKESSMRRYSRGMSRGPSCFGGAHTWYNDQVCRDMGYNPKRKKGFLAEWLIPSLPADYVDVTP
ncbi:hypothetical protein LUZ63_009697 [Rhynchospora breviuscula]|uniref:Flavin-containing monooxygenase n=1 Tax=Rhynchospora breviuscula TaxID=2022672 RepID=A0A9Q0HNX4_9POAL|nr:hypothetical protein LUZ63_009697 [Rhynchospora breviuscula]